MTDPLSNLTNWVTGAGTRFAAGCVLFFGIVKVFKEIEERLSENTKLEIWVWLAGQKPVGPRFQRWPDTFTDIFDRVFGRKHLSWRCFWRSCVASVIVITLMVIYDSLKRALHVDIRDVTQPGPSISTQTVVRILAAAYSPTILIDYLALLETRFCLSVMKKTEGVYFWSLVLIVDALLTTIAGVLAFVLVMLLTYGTRGLSLKIYAQHFVRSLPYAHYWFYPTLLTSTALWLYAGSGLLLKTARQFDRGFERFKRWFDIEHKPLQAIGIVSATIVTLLFWSAAVISRWRH